MKFSVQKGICDNDTFCRELYSQLDGYELSPTRRNVQYYEIPAAFDIEVTSFYEQGQKRAIMYHWQFGIFNLVTTGRTWPEFWNLLYIVRQIMQLDDHRRLIVYVHNLSYEFQFMRKWQEWQSVFLLDDRKPVYCLSNGIEFRCSVRLSQKKLSSVGKDLHRYPVSKMVGDLDYSVMRAPCTPLTPKELLYCENDVRVLLSYIQEKIEDDGGIQNIPLTNTGYVRRYCREECFKKYSYYRRLMDELQLEPEEFKQCRRAFQGGFTHANAHYVGKTLPGVHSCDITSSYPTVMLLEKFPMSRGRLVETIPDISELKRLLLTKCCMFDFEVWDLVPKLFQEHPLSSSKCKPLDGAVIDNGRVVMANHLKTTIVEHDLFTLNRFYSFGQWKISNMRVYDKGYLPKPFAMAVLQLYRDKTLLKGKKGEEVNYQIKKGMANSTFGMTVTNPIKERFAYRNHIFEPVKPDITEALKKYNESLRRFLFYPWGVWITAYARYNLFSSIIAMGNDYVYSDTDSNKFLNFEKHKEFFDSYNKRILEKIRKSADFFMIDEELYSPQGQTIGFWDDEGEYEKFKTLGAKRYLTFRYEEQKPFEEEGLTVQLTTPETKITVAGTNKEKTAAYLRSTLTPFESFNPGMVVPEEKSGRLIMTYFDEEIEGDFVDCNGEVYHYYEKSYVHAEPTVYSLSIAQDFKDYLFGIIDIGE